jgi:uncharacterized membrane protein YkoI
MRTLAFTAALVTLGTAAFAETTAPQTLSSLIAGLEAKGYQVLDADVEGSWLEVDAITKDGRPVEMIIDARTGAITHEGVDD